MKLVLNYVAAILGVGGGGQGRRGNRRDPGASARNLADLGEGDTGVLSSLDLPDDVALRLMELGFLPGTRIVAGKAAPGGDPRVYRVDGGEIALRRETALHMLLKGA